MWPDRVSNPGPLTYESGALPIALRGPASFGHSECNRVKTTTLIRPILIVGFYYIYAFLQFKHICF